MAKSSRMVLSVGAGFLLILVGVGLMAAYGLATNFFQTPWFIKFALPAMYYVGSLFVGVGILFFFIREKVWRCEHCREVRKR
ncbi:MAG: alkaline shock response membrane anchor protein AmaP [Desulfomonile sp.]|nr:alkaline shock response membrane anchor protein AmaP [Desulfomonile sp.]